MYKLLGELSFEHELTNLEKHELILDFESRGYDVVEETEDTYYIIKKLKKEN